RCAPGVRARRAAHRQWDTLREQHVRRMGGGAGATPRAAAAARDALRRSRQTEAVQQPAALLATAPVRSDSVDRGSCWIVRRCRAVVVLRLAERREEPSLPKADSVPLPG